MTKQDLIDNFGFKPIDTFTIMDSITLDIGRNRVISIGNVGNPNEMAFIAQMQFNSQIIDDLVCIHNYDYDGYMTPQRMALLIEFFKPQS